MRVTHKSAGVQTADGAAGAQTRSAGMELADWKKQSGTITPFLTEYDSDIFHKDYLYFTRYIADKLTRPDGSAPPASRGSGTR
jgi:hypothetical protein